MYYTRDIFFDKLAICWQTSAPCKPRFMETVSGDIPWMSPFDPSLAPFFPTRYPWRGRATDPLIRDERPIGNQKWTLCPIAPNFFARWSLTQPLSLVPPRYRQMLTRDPVTGVDDAPVVVIIQYRTWWQRAVLYGDAKFSPSSGKGRSSLFRQDSSGFNKIQSTWTTSWAPVDRSPGRG